MWCVTPQVRSNSSLRTQAEFINRLKEADIWSNVIIVVKQSVNPKYDARGALAAMQDFADTSKVSVIGYRFVSDAAFSESQRDLILADPRMREVMNVLTGEENNLYVVFPSLQDVQRSGDTRCDKEQD